MIPEKYKEYNPVYLAKGKRSIVYSFIKNNKKYVLKIKHPDSKAQDRMDNEARILKKLNKYKLGPKLIDSGHNFICLEYINGILLTEYLKDKKDFLAIKEVLKQCFILDKLRINKEEMHKPLKHIFIVKKKVVMIDFERCHSTDKSKNVTQFVQFISRMYNLDNEQLRFILSEYKKDNSEKKFKMLISTLKSMLN